MSDKPYTNRLWAWGFWLVLAGGLAAAFGPNFVEMWHRWFPAWHLEQLTLYQKITRGESYYTHGPLIPFLTIISCVLILRFSRFAVQPKRLLGLAVLIFFALVHLVACLARVNFISGFAFIGVLVGLVLFLWGLPALRKLWFPLLFLAFMIPLPEVSISKMNFRLKMIAVDWGVACANLIGIICEQAGNKVFLQDDKSLVIANVCNGLRTLISVMAFGAIYAFICRLRGIWKWVLFLFSVPIALVSNVIRITSLILVADIWNAQVATGWYHDVSGLMILVLSYFFYFSLEKLIFALHRRLGKPLVPAPLWDRSSPETKLPPAVKPLLDAVVPPRSAGALAVIIILAVGSWWLNRSLPPVYNEQTLAGVLPSQVNVQGRTWQSYLLDIDPTALLILETEDAMLRRYISPHAPIVDFCVIFSKDNRKGTHPPDVCLEGGGSDILLNNTILVDQMEGQDSLSCQELVVQNGANRTYYLYVYKCGNRYTNSFWVQQGIIFVNGLLHRNASGALIRVSTPIDQDTEPARQRAVAFFRVCFPYLDRSLP